MKCKYDSLEAEVEFVNGDDRDFICGACFAEVVTDIILSNDTVHFRSIAQRRGVAHIVMVI